MGATRNSGYYFQFPVRVLTLVAVLCSVAIGGCSRPDTLATIKAEGVLHVVTRNAPSIYYKDREGTTGFDYELAQRFADHLGVELRVRLMEGNSEILEVLDNGHAHIGFTGLSLAHDWEGRFRTLANGLGSGSVVIYHRGLEDQFDSVESLAQQDITVHAATETNHLPHLKQLQGERPQFSYRLHDGLDTAGILERVESGELRAAMVDANELALNHVFYPNVKRAFAVSEQESIAWLFPASNDGSLYREAEVFFARIREDGTLAHLRERFYGHLNQLGYVGSLTFEKHIQARLPEYRNVFRDYGKETGIDWRLLAAIGYQESNWRRDAVSPTGVRGLMMLTRNTADHVGINNRLDPEQSIKGGARYFREVRGMIPDDVKEPDRTWFALASYNVGYGHLEDARRLTESAGRDPDRWLDVKDFLPLLSQKKWYSKTRYGYARGHEPVLYVQNIRRYYDVLARRFNEVTKAEPTMMARSETGGLRPPVELLDYRVNLEQQRGEQETTLVLPRQMGITPPTL